MSDPIKRDDALELARLFHENYEKLAPEYGYKTRDETKDFDPTTANGQLMIATCGAVLSALQARIEELVKERDAYVEQLMTNTNTFSEMHLEIEQLRDKISEMQARINRLTLGGDRR